MKQFQPYKPIKRGYKVWCLADSVTGYILAYIVYTGKSDSSATFGLGEKVVLDLTTEVRKGSFI